MVDETNALVVVEEQPPEHIPPTYREIKPNDFIALKKDGIENIPPVQKFPYWLIARDGLFTIRDTALGRAVTRSKYFPSYLPKLGQGDGHFLWQTHMIPAEICAQVVDFFKTVFDKHGTEAEVILTMNYETNEWGVFAPKQTVSHGGVKHDMSPTDVPEKHLMVGTMHSHADFSPFHSGTDVADAEDMDGVHFTIGFVNRDEPEVVAMVMMNGVRFDYLPSEIADFSAIDMMKAPEEWYEKVTVGHVVSSHKPQGYEKSVYKYTKPESFNKDNWKPVHNPREFKSYQPPYFGMGGWEDWDDNDWDEWYKTTYEGKRPEQSDDTIRKARLDSAHWEDYLNDELLDQIIESNVWTDSDMDDATASPADAQDADWWRTKFLSKLGETVNILWKLGMNVEYQAKMREGYKWGQQFKKEDKTLEQKFEDSIIEGEFELLPDDTLDKSLAQKIAESPLAQKLIDEGFEVLDVVDGAVSIDVAKVKE